jgi:pyruvate formate lyase activating enzyme
MMSPDRRDFVIAAGAAGLVSLLPRRARAQQDEASGLSFDPDQGFAPVEARYYAKLAEQRIECQLCPHRCKVADLERGTCGVRENRGGTYYTLVHSRAVSANVDPIEKKPLFHFLPGTTAFSIATAGCNMECKFCQNWQISQFRPEQVKAMRLPPARVHEMAKSGGCRSIAYTYSEPTIYYEYLLDTAALGKKTGVRSVVVSAGYIEEQPLRDLLPHVDAIKIDLKSFRQQFYDNLCRGQLRAVLRSLEIIRSAGRWLEIVVLVIPTMNDSEAEIRDMTRWVKSTLGPDVPMHFTRFHPTYRLRALPRTPTGTMERCHQIAKAEGINFAYLGNVAGHPAENTYCPGCQELVIRRVGMGVEAVRLTAGQCPKCKRAVPGVWS